MRKLILSIVSLLAVMGLNAQNAEVQSAYDYYRDGRPILAVKSINKAIEHPSTKGEDKTWFYRGNIYLQLDHISSYTDRLSKGMKEDELIKIYGEAQKIRRAKEYEDGSRYYYQYDLVVYLSGDDVVEWEMPNLDKYKEFIAKMDKDVLQIAYNSYQKAIKLDEDQNLFSGNMVPTNPKLGLKAVGDRYYNKGVDAYDKQKYEVSLVSFEEALKVYKSIGQDNNDLKYYTGVSAYQINDTAKTIKHFQALADMGYKQVPVYTVLTSIYSKMGEMEKAYAAVKKGRKMYPENETLLLMQTNLYLKEGKTDEANELLQEAVKKQPDNEQLYFNIGANYDKVMNDTTKSEEMRANAFKLAIDAYEKALDINPEYDLALFNIGAIYNNKAAEKFTEARQLPLDATEKYNKLMKEGEELLQKALPYLEKAHEVNPKDRDTMVLLKGIYLQLKMNDKLKSISSKLK